MLARVLEPRADPAAVLRGARRRAGAVRVGPPEAAAGDPRVRGRGPAGRRPLRRVVPDRAPAAARAARAVRAADRRDRPRGLGVRGVPARVPDATSRSRSRSSGRCAPPSAPVVVMTSNRTRELHDALKRRCLYHWIAFPDAARERRDHRGAGAGPATRTRPRRWSRRSSGVRGPVADQAARDRRDDRVGAGREGARRRGRGLAGRAAPLARPAASRSRRTRSASLAHADGLGAVTAARARAACDGVPRARSTTSASRSRRGSTSSTALRDDPPDDITRFYWLARVTLVSARRGHPARSTRCSPRSSLACAAARRAPQDDAARSEAPQPQGAGEPHAGRARPRARASAPASTTCANARTLRRTDDGPARAARARSTSTCRRSARAGGGRTGAAALDLRRTLRHATAHGRDHDARAPRRARTARGRCCC